MVKREKIIIERSVFFQKKKETARARGMLMNLSGIGSLLHKKSFSQVSGLVLNSMLLPAVLMLSLISPVAIAMTEMKDSELSAVSGQALLQMNKTPGAGSSSDVTFYKAGLDAELELNLNIEKLQLGCTAGAINGQYCDIDIDRVSLSGRNWSTDRPESSALLTRPFFEFAIKNDQTATLREVMGIRLSAENAFGMMTFGDQTEGMSEANSNNGINSLSGYMEIGSATGVAQTTSRPMSYANTTFNGQNYAGLGQPITGNIWLTVLGIINDVVGITSTDYNLILDSATANVVTNPTTVSGKRLTEVNLQGAATINPINFAGPMQANVQNLLGLGIDLDLDKDVTGTITGLTADVPIVESLGFIHKLDIDNAFSLSMQSNDVLWPGAATVAQQGWWLAFEDEIDIGSISPANEVALTNDVLLQVLNGATGNAGTGTNCTTASVNCALFRGLGTRNGEPYGIRCNGLSACLGGSLPIGTVNVPREVVFPLENLKLGAQNVTPNCYGSARFC